MIGVRSKYCPSRGVRLRRTSAAEIHVRNLRFRTFLSGSALSLAVLVGVMYFLWSRVQLSSVVDLLKGIYLPAVAVFIGLSLSTSILRTWRYAILLRIAGQRAPFVPLFLIVLVRNLCADLLPASIGSAAYIVLVRWKLGVALTPAATSFALCMAFDLLAVGILVFAAIIGAGSALSFSPLQLAAAGLVLATGAALGVLLLPRMISLLRRWLPYLKMLPDSTRSRLKSILVEVEQEVASTVVAGVYAKIAALSVAIRALKYICLYVFLYALLQPLGYQLTQLNLPRTVLAFCASEFAASLPISGIAGFGAYEGVWAASFRLLGYPPHIADLTAVSHHLFTQLYGYGLGILALIVLTMFKITWVRSGGVRAGA